MLLATALQVDRILRPGTVPRNFKLKNYAAFNLGNDSAKKIELKRFKQIAIHATNYANVSCGKLGSLSVSGAQPSFNFINGLANPTKKEGFSELALNCGPHLP